MRLRLRPAYCENPVLLRAEGLQAAEVAQLEAKAAEFVQYPLPIWRITSVYQNRLYTAVLHRSASATEHLILVPLDINLYEDALVTALESRQVDEL